MSPPSRPPESDSTIITGHKNHKQPYVVHERCVVKAKQHISNISVQPENRDVRSHHRLIAYSTQHEQGEKHDLGHSIFRSIVDTPHAHHLPHWSSTYKRSTQRIRSAGMAVENTGARAKMTRQATNFFARSAQHNGTGTGKEFNRTAMAAYWALLPQR